MRRLVAMAALLSLLLSEPARAADKLQGAIVTTGASKNNLTTAAPFVLGLGHYMVQCTVDTHVGFSTNDGGTATSGDAFIRAGAMYDFETYQSSSVVSIVPDAGGADTCRLYVSSP